MIEARHLVKRYSSIAVVKDVSFRLAPGDIVGYLGPNGSGKTTTLRMLTGLTEPTAGTVLFENGNIHDDLVAFRRRLGYVPEEAHVYTFLSGREYLEFVGQLRGLRRSLLDRKIDGLLALFGLSSAGDQRLSRYSKGMRQKILISAALLHDPQILLLDEPESGLDVSAGLVLRHLLQTLAARGKAILYSSHMLESIERICQRVLLINEGRIVADDSVAHLRAAMAASSLEDVAARFLLREDPQQIAVNIADLCALSA